MEIKKHRFYTLKKCELRKGGIGVRCSLPREAYGEFKKVVDRETASPFKSYTNLQKGKTVDLGLGQCRYNFTYDYCEYNMPLIFGISGVSLALVLVVLGVIVKSKKGGK